MYTNIIYESVYPLSFVQVFLLNVNDLIKEELEGRRFHRSFGSKKVNSTFNIKGYNYTELKCGFVVESSDSLTFNASSIIAFISCAYFELVGKN